MMVAIIENYAAIEGQVVTTTDHPRLPGYLQVKVALTKSAAIEGYPNLAAADEGNTISINIKKDAAGGHAFKTHAPFTATVKKAAGQEYFIR